MALALPFPSRRSLMAGTLAALALVLPSFWSLSWALNKSDKVFFSVFAAGTLARLAGLALTAFVVYRYTTLSLVAVLVSLATAFIVLSVVEMYFIQKQSRMAQ